MTAEPDDAPPGWKAKAKRLAAPAVARARDEVVRATANDVVALRGEIADLRVALQRQQAEHAAAIAALQEEISGLLADRRR